MGKLTINGHFPQQQAMLVYQRVLSLVNHRNGLKIPPKSSPTKIEAGPGLYCGLISTIGLVRINQDRINRQKKNSKSYDDHYSDGDHDHDEDEDDEDDDDDDCYY